MVKYGARDHKNRDHASIDLDILKSLESGPISKNELMYCSMTSTLQIGTHLNYLLEKNLVGFVDGVFESKRGATYSRRYFITEKGRSALLLYSQMTNDLTLVAAK
jgi:predicted transcriptional regulator